MSDAVDDMVAYTALTDNILHVIQFSGSPELAEVWICLSTVLRIHTCPYTYTYCGAVCHVYIECVCERARKTDRQAQTGHMQT